MISVLSLREPVIGNVLFITKTDIVRVVRFVNYGQVGMGLTTIMLQI